MKGVTVSMSEEMIAAVDEIAKEKILKRSDIIRIATGEYIKKHGEEIVAMLSGKESQKKK